MTRKPKPAPEFPCESGTNGEFRHLLEQMDVGEKITDGRNKAAWWRAVEILRTLPPTADLEPVRDLVQSWVDANCGGNLDEVDIRKQVRGAARFVAEERASTKPPRDRAEPVSAGTAEPARATRDRGLTSSPFRARRSQYPMAREAPMAACSLRATRRGDGCGQGHLHRGTGCPAEPTEAWSPLRDERGQRRDRPQASARRGRRGHRPRVRGARARAAPDDIGELRRLAGEIESLTLLVIDPVANHIGDRNTNSDAEVRDAIAPLNKLADELDCLLLGRRHPGKDRSRGALASILGSTAWVDTPRAIVMVAIDDVEDDVRHIQVVAGNRSRNGRAQSFRIGEAHVDGLDEPVTVAIQLGESTKSVNDLIGADRAGGGESRSSEAKDLVLNILEVEGKQESDALDARVARETGLAAKTVKNLRVALKNEGLIKTFPEKDDTGAVTRWMVFRTKAPRS